MENGEISFQNHTTTLSVPGTPTPTESPTPTVCRKMSRKQSRKVNREPSRKLTAPGFQDAPKYFKRLRRTPSSVSRHGLSSESDSDMDCDAPADTGDYYFFFDC